MGRSDFAKVIATFFLLFCDLSKVLLCSMLVLRQEIGRLFVVECRSQAIDPKED